MRKERNVRRKWPFWAALAIPAFIVFVGVGGVVVMQLWNWLLPPLFGWREVTFWQALGILALSRILFGGLGGHGVRRSNSRRRTAERWEQLTPEERERFRQGLRGVDPSTSESKGDEP